MRIFIGYEQDGKTPKYTSDINEVRKYLCDDPMFKDHEGVWWCLPQDPAATVGHLCNLVAAQEEALKDIRKSRWPIGAIRKAKRIMKNCPEAKEDK